MALSTKQEIASELESLAGWARNGNSIRKQYTFASFAEAMAFANRVAALAEQQDHHPDILIQFSKVTLTTSSHDAGGLTSRDFRLAQAVDA